MYTKESAEFTAFKRLAHSTRTLIALANRAAGTLPENVPIPEELWNLLALAREIGKCAADACETYFDSETADALSNQLDKLDRLVEIQGYCF